MLVNAHACVKLHEREQGVIPFVQSSDYRNVLSRNACP